MNNRKRTFLSIATLGIIVLSGLLASCGKSDDGPLLSDDELLKRGRAGHEAATGAAKPPAGTPGSPDQLNNQGGRGLPASPGK